ncbi:zinc finger protein 821 isoform X2 [Seriola lalandi dorsalis]|uniref:zinc finger protein 821 isoform X2 n=1 Tax=Seriola lalandi dorsalis TaxID=1841481 RepID=UPI000C6F506E|nr:zinc finger protein 821 isoform X2 [Seriola lalandi dorsalis]XP_056239998.1 zinc finger protein 821 isoform X2 [Seriola aureovittata]
MSRRKQTNPFKVNWPFHTSGITGFQHTINMDGRDEFTEDSECCSNNSQEVHGQDSISEDSDSDPDNHGEDSSSNTSADDHMTTKRTQCRLQGAGVKESEEGADHINNFVCPLCTLDFSSPEKLISHVYQHTTMMSNTKSYVCPVCGRALSSPGSLGRHLLIHSEDRLSNCAVCGARFTDTNNFNREKLKDVLDTTRMDVSDDRDTCSMSQSLSSSPMDSPGPGTRSCHGPGPSPSSCQGPRSCQAPDPSPNLCQGHRTCQGPGHMSSQCQGPRSCHGAGPGSGPCSGPGPCTGSDQGPSFPSLPDSLLSEGPSLASIPDALNSSSSGLPPIPDILSPMPVYPAGVLLVCNSCVAYQQLVEAQSPLRKWALRRKNEPLEARLQRLERERTAKKNKRACETDEERELRRLRDREAKRMQRMQETEEQRARRLQRDREAMRLKRANETPEKRQARLIREREAKRIKRRLEKIDPALRTQIEHDPAAMAALTADMSLFQFPCPMPVPSIDNGLFMKLP